MNATDHAAFVEPQWNAWEEDQYSTTPSFEPLNTIEPDSTYSLFVDLAAIQYADHIEYYGPFSRKVSSGLTAWLKGNPKATEIEIVAIPDERFFEGLDQQQRVQHLTVNLNKVRTARLKGVEKPRYPFKYLQAHPHASFSFGQKPVSFRLETKKHRTGLASVALSFWVNRKPVDEISVPICIVEQPSTGVPDDCQEPITPTYSLRGVDPVNHDSYPDAALHLVQLNSNTLVGVFRCNSCSGSQDDGYLTWTLRRTPAQLIDDINDNVVSTFEAASQINDEEQMRQAGRALYNVIFEENDTNDVSDAENAFITFVGGEIARQRKSDAPVIATSAPSIFMRLLPNESDVSFAVPLDLMVVAAPDGTEEYLGFHFRIEAPLQLQSYVPPKACVSSWKLMMPPPPPLSSEDMKNARKPFEKWIGEFRNWKSHADVESDAMLFDGWLGKRERGKDGLVVLTLSHHARGKLCFSDPSCKGHSVLSADIRRSFPSPSLAVINACGTAQPGASEFIRKLNFSGIETIIATSTAVDGSIAGQFLSKFLYVLHDNTDPAYTIGHAKFDTVAGLRKKYGARVLSYTLLGNDSVKVCTPPKRPEEDEGSVAGR